MKPFYPRAKAPGLYGLFPKGQREEVFAALRESEARYRRIVETAIEGILALDREIRITFVNTQMVAMLGYTAEELVGYEIKAFLAPDQLSDHVEQMDKGRKGQDAVYERCFIRKDGVRYWVLVSAKAIMDEAGAFVGSFAMFTDINERKRLEAKLHQQATTDELTRVANRRHFLALAHTELERALRFKHPLSLALIDFDHFKQINDTYGHAAGDQALIAVTQIFQQNLREIDLFARFGGDEFVLLLPETELGQARLVLERVRNVLTAQPLVLHGKPVPITLSIGLGCVVDDGDLLDTLLERADRALYQAKTAGRNRIMLCP